jgi:hypothetical protein
MMMMSMGGHYFVKDGETIFDLSASKDKDFIVVEGRSPRHDAIQALLRADGRCLRQCDEESL